jgi:hypothetical protein
MPQPPQLTEPQLLFFMPHSPSAHVGRAQQELSLQSWPMPQPPQSADPHMLLLVPQSPFPQAGRLQH